MMKKGIGILLLVFWHLGGWAQEAVLPDNLFSQGDDILYQSEWAVEIKILTQGSSIGFYKGELETFKKTNFRVFEIGHLRHPKEIKQNRQRSGGGVVLFIPGSNFVYGKQNTFLTAKYGWGAKRYLSNKGKRKGVALGAIYSAGPTIGLLKPYYLDLNLETQGGLGSEIVATRFSEETREDFLDDSKIRGHSGFFRGFGESSFRIGGHARGGLLISPGAFDSMVRALEVGVQIDAFTRDVPIMILEENRFLFVQFYVSVHLGKRKKY